MRQPDLVVVSEAQIHGPELVAPPLLAIEVLSPHSRETDLITKRREYAAAGLEWYWIVDPDPKAVEVAVLRLEDGAYEQHAFAAGEDVLTVPEPVSVRFCPADLGRD